MKQKIWFISDCSKYLEKIKSYHIQNCNLWPSHLELGATKFNSFSGPGKMVQARPYFLEDFQRDLYLLSVSM